MAYHSVASQRSTDGKLSRPVGQGYVATLALALASASRVSRKVMGVRSAAVRSKVRLLAPRRSST